MEKVGIIGRFGLGKNFCDGQTVKTKNLAWLLEREPQLAVTKVDTYLFKRKNIRLLIDTLKCLFTCKHVFLMVSVNGMNFYLPFLYHLNKLTKRNIYHYIIGSELLDMVNKNHKLVKYLNALNVNWFEYDSGTMFLQQMGVKNAVTLPNFKLLTPVDKPVSYDTRNNEFRFCTFSRVMKEKGITDAILAIKAINESHKGFHVFLDIYGPIDPAYEDDLNALLSENTDCVKYVGIINSTQSVEILKNYYGLLFPTHWLGEGVPGTIIDAFAAGIPIIASDWNANREIIQDGKQGIIYPSPEIPTLTDAIYKAISDPAMMNALRVESLKTFNTYNPEAVRNVIMAEISRKQ